MDVATLGIEVTSTNVQKATADLNQLSVAAAKAEANAAKLARQKMGLQQSYAAAKAAENMARAAELAAKAEGNLNREQMEALRNARQLAIAHTQGARAKLEEARAADVLARSEARATQEALRHAQAQRDTMPGPANGNSRRANTANIAAQFQDIGVTAAMGMNPLMIALQQGTQLSAVLTSMEKPLQGLSAAFLGLLSVTSLLTIGFIALVAALLQWVDWAGLAANAIDWLAANLQTIAPYAVAAAAALALIFAPTIVGGIISLIALIARVGVAATAAGAQMAAAWVIASGPIGWLITGVGLILAALYVFRDEVMTIFGVDIIQVTYQAVNTIIGSFVAAFHDIQFVWAQLPTIIGAAAIGAANQVISAVNAMVSATIGAINRLIASVKTVFALGGAVGAGMDVQGSLDKVKGISDTFQAPQIKEIANQSAELLANAVKARNVQLKEDLSKDYLGTIGGAIATGAEKAVPKLKELSKWMTDVEDKKKKATGGGGKAKGGGAGAAEKDPYGDIVNGAQRRIAELQAEKDAIGLSAEETARLRYETELLNQAKAKNIALSPRQREELAGLAAEMSKLEADTKRAKDAIAFAKDITKGFFSDFRQGIAEGKSVWEAFGDAAMNVLDKIVDKLMNDVIDALFQTGKAAGGLLGGGGGGGGGLLGGLLSMLFSAKGNAFGAGGVKMFAKGGAFTNSVVSSPTLFKFAKGAGMMGEAGPEAIMPLSRDANGRLGVTALDRRGSNDNGPVVIAGSFDVFVNQDGQWEATVREIAMDESTKTTKAGLNAFSQKELPGRMEQINKNPRRRG